MEAQVIRCSLLIEEWARAAEQDAEDQRRLQEAIEETRETCKRFSEAIASALARKE